MHPARSRDRHSIRRRQSRHPLGTRTPATLSSMPTVVSGIAALHAGLAMKTVEPSVQEKLGALRATLEQVQMLLFVWLSSSPPQFCLSEGQNVQNGSMITEAAKTLGAVHIHCQARASCRRDCHSATPPSPFSECFDSDGDRASAK